MNTYTYDNMGRRLTERADPDAFPNEVGITFTYDALGRIETMADASGTTTMSYDARGNLLGKTNAAGTLTYDGDGNRVGKIVSGFSSLPSALKTTWYLVDTQNLTLEGCFQRDEMDAFFRVVSKDPSAKPDFHGCPVSVRRGSVVSAATATFGSRGKPRDHGRVPNRTTKVMRFRSWMTLVVQPEAAWRKRHSPVSADRWEMGEIPSIAPRPCGYPPRAGVQPPVCAKKRDGSGSFPQNLDSCFPTSAHPQGSGAKAARPRT